MIERIDRSVRIYDELEARAYCRGVRRNTRNTIRSGGGNTLSPVTILGSNLDFWIHAGAGLLNGSGVFPSNGDGVKNWNDQSGTGVANKHLVQNTAGNRPVWNASSAAFAGRPTVSFTRASGHDMASAAWSPAAATVWAVLKGGSTVAQVWFSFSITTNNDGTYLNAGGNTDLHQFGSVDLSANGLVTDVTQMAIYAIDDNGASTNIYQNALTAVKSGTTGAPTRDGVTLGDNNGGGGGLNADMELAELVRAKSVVSANVNRQMLQYLGAKYRKAIGP